MDEAGVITGQEDDRRSKFLGRSDATRWCERSELIHHLFGDCFHHQGAHQAGGYGVDPNATRAVFSRSQAFVKSSRAARLAP